MGQTAIIILNWNGVEDTLECLRSLEKLTRPAYRVYVVDNGSTDGSVPRIKELFPSARVIENGRNLGFAQGNNVGMQAALDDGAAYLFLLNNDTIVDADMLRFLEQAAEEHPEAGVFGAKVYYYDRPDTIWFAGGLWNQDAGSFLHIGKDMPDTYQEVREIDYATGCALFLRREVAEKTGLLDPAYFLTFEETDWCFRARRAGFRILFVPKAKIWHKVSVSFGGDASPLYAYYDSRNMLLWTRKNIALRQRWQVYKRVVRQARSFRAAGSERLIRRARMQGIRDFIFRRCGECPDGIYALNREYAALKERT